MAVSRHQGVHLLLSRVSATLLDQLMVIISQREPPPGFMPLRQLLIKAECFGAFAVKKEEKKSCLRLVGISTIFGDCHQVASGLSREHLWQS